MAKKFLLVVKTDFDNGIIGGKKMKYADWKDIELITINKMLKMTLNQYAWIRAITANASLGAAELAVFVVMLLTVDGITPFMVGVMSEVMIIILVVGTFFLKKDYLEEAIDEIQITELSEHDLED